MQLISGPGVGLQLPQNLYPSELYNAPYDLSTNYVALNAGDALPIPSGRYMVDVGSYALLQFLDPVTGIWRQESPARTGPQVVYGDGFTRRVANLTGCPVAAVVANGGTSFVQSTAVITATTGGSTWQAIVGGSLSVVSVGAAGANYSEAPLVFIPAPPSPGIQATGYATLANGTVASVSLTNFGAGYTTAPTAVLLANPTDVNFGSITQATVVLGVTNAGVITGALCTNPGAPLATLTALTLTASGGSGSGATITPQILQSVKSVSVVAAGAALGTVAAPAKIVSTGGGALSVSAITNPIVELTGFKPRSFDGIGICGSTGTITSVTVLDGGLFLQAPTAAICPGAGGGSAPTLASLTFTMGNQIDTVLLQPL